MTTDSSESTTTETSDEGPGCGFYFLLLNWYIHGLAGTALVAVCVFVSDWLPSRPAGETPPMDVIDYVTRAPHALWNIAIIGTAIAVFFSRSLSWTARAWLFGATVAYGLLTLPINWPFTPHLLYPMLLVSTAGFHRSANRSFTACEEKENA